MGEFGHPVWLAQYAAEAVVLGLIVWFPLYFWLKDRRRRRETETRKPE
jgi:hypothetical protein